MSITSSLNFKFIWKVDFFLKYTNMIENNLDRKTS